jgi:ABC-type lipoprotein export system ATPase subunit
MKLTILPGIDKSGNPENFDEINLCPGDTVSVVGNTGSGKSNFINDIEVLAQGDTVSKRRILIDGQPPPNDMVRDPAKKPIAMITQNTRVIADVAVSEFVSIHSKARGSEIGVNQVVSLANKFTGEMISETSKISSLSGGQTKSLLIADAVLISNAPILLLDEVENAGIYKDRFIDILRTCNKAVIFVTHNPLLSVITGKRIIMKNGAVSKIIVSDGTERKAVERLRLIDEYLMKCREFIRSGEVLR